MTKFQVNQRVCEARDGWGVIKQIDRKNDYPISVVFLNGEMHTYTLDGKNISTDLYSSLYTFNIIERNTARRVLVEVKGEWVLKQLLTQTEDGVYCYPTMEDCLNDVQSTPHEILTEFYPNDMWREIPSIPQDFMEKILKEYGYNGRVEIYIKSETGNSCDTFDLVE